MKIEVDPSQSRQEDINAGAPENTVPQGFVAYTSPSPFVSHLGAMYQRDGDAGTIIIGLRIGNEHINLHRNAHGGMLSALIDNALGFNVSRAWQQPVVTAHLSIDYFEPVQFGDWIEAHVAIRKLGGRMCFADCSLMVGTRTVVRGSGILSLIKRS